MKRFYLILLSALFIVIVGTPSAVRSQTLSVLHSFSWSASGPFNDGYAPASYDAAGGQNILVYNGRLYGLTMYGGSDANNVGVLFSCLPDGTDWRILHYFSTVTGGYRPWGSLIEVGGTLYGTTYYGGASGSDQRGTIFSISPFSGLPYTSNYTVLHTFNFPDAIYYPHGTLYHYNGVLYGTCSGGTG